MREEDLVPNVPCLLTLSSRGYVKRLAPETFEAQRRGGKGEMEGGGVPALWRLAWWLLPCEGV
jgi:DNA gyrase subunit A